VSHGLHSLKLCLQKTSEWRLQFTNEYAILVLFDFSTIIILLFVQPHFQTFSPLPVLCQFPLCICCGMVEQNQGSQVDPCSVAFYGIT